MSPRVALFLTSLEGGGVERAFVELANQFVGFGIDVDFVLLQRSGPYLEELSSAVRVIDLGTRQKLKSLLAVTRYLRRVQPTALLSGSDLANPAAIMASGLAGVSSRCVISQRSLLRPVLQLERPRSWRAWLWAYRRLYPRARLVICNSRAAYGEMTTDVGVKPEHCVVVHNAVDVANIERRASERVDDPWLREDAPPLVIAVGSLWPIKDFPTLIEAFAIARRQRDANLLILGDGPQRKQLEHSIAAFGLEAHVRMPGFVPNPFPFISGARVLVSSSLIEGGPNVVQQALACGTPVVATDCPGGTAEILENGRWGRLVPVGDPHAMADAILATLDDRMPVDGRRRAADFDPRRTADTYLRLVLGGINA